MLNCTWSLIYPWFIAFHLPGGMRIRKQSFRVVRPVSSDCVGISWDVYSSAQPVNIVNLCRHQGPLRRSFILWRPWGGVGSIRSLSFEGSAGSAGSAGAVQVDHEAFVDGGFVANTPIMKASCCRRPVARWNSQLLAAHGLKDLLWTEHVAWSMGAWIGGPTNGCGPQPHWRTVYISFDDNVWYMILYTCGESTASRFYKRKLTHVLAWVIAFISRFKKYVVEWDRLIAL